MKIGFDAKRLYNNFTGLGNYSRTLVSNLQHYFPEEEYHLYTPKIKKEITTIPFLESKLYNTHCYQSWCKNLWRTSWIKKDLKKDQIDLYHGLSHELPTNIDKTGIRSIVTMHDVIFLTFPDMYTAIDRTIYNYKFRYACQHADKIIAISQCTRQDLIHYFGVSENKIEVIYQAIQPTFYQMQSQEQAIATIQKYGLPEDYLLYVGAINARKNLLNLIKALPLLPKELQIPLIVVGNGHQYKTEVQKYIQKAHLTHQVIFINNLHDPIDLQAFYQRAKIFIYPSYYEGFGLPVTEALLSKVPVITSNRSSLPEAGGPNSCYINPDSPEEIAQAIDKVLSDEQQRKQMIELGFSFAQQQFNVQQLTKQVHDLYYKICANHE